MKLIGLIHVLANTLDVFGDGHVDIEEKRLSEADPTFRPNHIYIQKDDNGADVPLDGPPYKLVVYR